MSACEVLCPGVCGRTDGLERVVLRVDLANAGMVFPLSVLVCDAHRAWAFAVVGAFGGKPGGKEPTKKKAR